MLCITRMALLREEGIEPEQVSLFVGPKLRAHVFKSAVATFSIQFVIGSGKEVQSFAVPGPAISRTRCSMRSSTGSIRFWETFGEKLEALEDEIMTNPQPAVLHEIHKAKRDLLAIRRAIWPQREAVNALIRDEKPAYYRDRPACICATAMTTVCRSWTVWRRIASWPAA